MQGKGDIRRPSAVNEGRNDWHDDIDWVIQQRRKIMAKIKENIEQQLINRIVDGEFATANMNRDEDNNEFDSYIDLLDSVREAKDYDWMSDIRIPEFISHVLTQASIDANQYFTTRDFVEVYLEDASDEAVKISESAKECINRTLNQRHLFHYLKYMRSKSLITLLVGSMLDVGGNRKLKKN